MDVRDDPAVAILVDLLELDDLALDQIPERLPGDVAERLGFFGGVDAVEPDLLRRWRGGVGRPQSGYKKGSMKQNRPNGRRHRVPVWGVMP